MKLLQQVKVKISTKFGFRGEDSNLCEVDLDEEIKTALEIIDFNLKTRLFNQRGTVV